MNASADPQTGFHRSPCSRLNRMQLYEAFSCMPHSLASATRSVFLFQEIVNLRISRMSVMNKRTQMQNEHIGNKGATDPQCNGWTTHDDSIKSVIELIRLTGDPSCNVMQFNGRFHDPVSKSKIWSGIPVYPTKYATNLHVCVPQKAFHFKICSAKKVY